MAKIKSYPYFKFDAARWLTGDIIFRPLEEQGLFLNICALYWQKKQSKGTLFVSDVLLRFNKPEILSQLEGVFFTKTKRGEVKIKFLDEQIFELESESKTNSFNGKLGGRPKGAKTGASKITEKKRPVNLEKRTESEPKAKKSHIDIEVNTEEEVKINIEEEKEVSGKKIIYPFNSMDFKVAWYGWTNHLTNEHKRPYQTFSAEQAAVDDLANFSQNNEARAIHNIKYSISKNWKSLHADKDYGKQQQLTREDKRQQVAELGQDAINKLLAASNSENGPNG